MNQVELSLLQSLKVLWSFLWRSSLLMLPIMILMLIAMRFLIPMPKPGEAPVAPDPKQIPLFMLIWLIMMVTWIVTQGFALCWALKTNWSDFRIIPISTQKSDQPTND